MKYVILIIALIALIVNIFNAWMNYYKSKETFSPPLKQLKENVNVFYSNYYVKLVLQIMNTATTIVLIFLGFVVGLSVWVLKFQQSTGGLFLGLALFSFFIVFGVFYYINNDLFDEPNY